VTFRSVQRDLVDIAGLHRSLFAERFAKGGPIRRGLSRQRKEQGRSQA